MREILRSTNGVHQKLHFLLALAILFSPLFIISAADPIEEAKSLAESYHEAPLQEKQSTAVQLGEHKFHFVAEFLMGQLTAEVSKFSVAEGFLVHGANGEGANIDLIVELVNALAKIAN